MASLVCGMDCSNHMRQLQVCAQLTCCYPENTSSRSLSLPLSVLLPLLFSTSRAPNFCTTRIHSPIHAMCFESVLPNWGPVTCRGHRERSRGVLSKIRNFGFKIILHRRSEQEKNVIQTRFSRPNSESN